MNKLIKSLQLLFNKSYQPNLKSYKPLSRFSTSLIDRSKFLNDTETEIFADPTKNNISKYILTSGKQAIILDILRTFTGYEDIMEYTLIDEYLVPFGTYEKASNFINSQPYLSFLEEFNQMDDDLKQKKFGTYSKFLNEFFEIHKDIINGWPKVDKDSRVDFRCKTSRGYINVEFQVKHQNLWNKRALFYLANMYVRQIGRSEDYSKLEKVIGINILGNFKSQTKLFRDGRFLRDYRFLDLYDNENVIPEMRLIQVSLPDFQLEKVSDSRKKKLSLWTEFFKSACQYKEIPNDVVGVVRDAYDMIRVENLKKVNPELVKSSKDDSADKDIMFVEALEDVAKKLIILNSTPDEHISEATKVSMEVLKAMRKEIEEAKNKKSS